MSNTLLYDKVKQAILKFDAWKNSYTGHGTARDKMTFSAFGANGRLEDEYLDGLYHGDDMAARACDAIPEEMLRRGFSIKSDDVDTETLTDIKAQLDELGMTAKFVDASVWARAFGGCIVFIGADDGISRDPNKLREPLNEEGLKSIFALNIIDKRYAMPNSWYKDPADPKYGLPETYLVTPHGKGGFVSADSYVIHETRTIRFDGLRASTAWRQENNGWGLSLLQRMHEILMQFGMSFEGLAHLLSDANQGVFKMQGLFEALAAKDSSLIQQRMAMLDMNRSDMRALVLDAESEDFQRQNFNWSGIKDPFTMMMLRLSAAARVPVTILMGQSPAGMDATGESDIRWFYDQVESRRTDYLDPKIYEMIRLVTLSTDGPTNGKELENVNLDYPSLWQPTEKERAETYETTARGDVAYIDAGVLLPEEVALSRFTPDGWSYETTINAKAREDIIDVKEIELGDDSTGDVMVGTTPGEEIQKTALNGAQVAALVDVSSKVSSGELSKESGIEILSAAFPEINRDQIIKIIGDLGRSE
jgi:phage-related protein (TIGR01555 family)